MGKARDHCGSYYAASLDGELSFPALEGDLETDVCIIGGGFSGVSTALTLAERNRSVVLLEANRIGWGASGRNGGQLIGGFLSETKLAKSWGRKGRTLLRDLHYRGHEIIEDRLERYAIRCDYRQGSLVAAIKPSHMKGLIEDFEEQTRWGHGDLMELVEERDLPDILGTDIYAGGLINSRNAHLHPLKLCQGEARAAAGLGAQIFEASEAVNIEADPKSNWVAIPTRQGTIRARHAVIAGNAYHHLLPGALAGYLFPASTFIIATEQLGEALAKQINPRDLAVIDTNNVIDYFRLSPDKRMLFGGLCNYANRDPSDIVAALRPRMVRIYPQLHDTEIAYAWGGQIGIVLTRVPLVRRLAPNIIVMQGYSGHGINVSHIVGEMVADAIAGDTERLELFENVRQLRGPANRWLGNQLLALGMAYFKLRDQL